MELGQELAEKNVYVDTNIIIYLVEGFQPYQKAIDEIQLLLEIDKLQACTSELSLCEVLVKPYKIGSDYVANLFRTFLEESGSFEMFAIDKDILMSSAHISATTGIKTPDAIHVATALANDCGIFLSNDKAIPTPKSLKKVLLSDYLD